MLESILDVVGAVMILIGATFTLTAAIGLVRLPDVLNRMHAASKPQTLGFLLLCGGLAVVLRDPGATTLLALAAGMQLVTAPVSLAVVVRAAVVDDHDVGAELARAVGGLAHHLGRDGRDENR